MFDSWKGYSLICPDYSEFKLQGNLAQMISQNIEMRLSKCQEDCSPEMDQYVKDIQIDTWAIYEKIDLAKREGKPVYQVMDMQGTWIANEETAINTNYYLKKNIINTRDAVLYLGQLSYSGEFYDIGKMINRPIIKTGVDDIS